MRARIPVRNYFAYEDAAQSHILTFLADYHHCIYPIVPSKSGILDSEATTDCIWKGNYSGCAMAGKPWILSPRTDSPILMRSNAYT